MIAYFRDFFNRLRQKRLTKIDISAIIKSNRKIFGIKIMKKILSILLVLVLSASCLVGCGKSDNGKFNIVCTVFPIYDWVAECTKGAEGIEVTLIVDSGTDTHSYNANTEDIAEITEADLVICVGGESDEWIERVISNLGDKAPKTLRLIDLVADCREHGDLCEEEGHEHSHEHGEEHEHSSYDEHVWLSLKNAIELTGEIAKTLTELLPEAKDAITASAESYKEKLRELDAEAEATVAGAERKVLLFADRFPFKYLVEDYGIEYHAAFSGCSADSEASFETVARLAAKLDELGLPYVLVLESSDKKIAETVIEASEAKSAEILTIDSMQSISKKDIESGASYLGIMRENVAVLRCALSE